MLVGQQASGAESPFAQGCVASIWGFFAPLPRLGQDVRGAGTFPLLFTQSGMLGRAQNITEFALPDPCRHFRFFPTLGKSIVIGR